MDKYDDQGRELMDPTPIAIPVGFRRPPSLQEQIRDMVRGELSRRASQVGAESFEEADDFDVDDDPELKSPYEVDEGLPRWDEKGQRKAAVEEAEKRALSFKAKTKPKAGDPAAGGPPGPDQQPEAKAGQAPA